MKKILLLAVLMVLLLLIGCAAPEAPSEPSEPKAPATPEVPSEPEAPEVPSEPEVPVAPAEGNVVLKNGVLEPAEITIKVGGSVTWTVESEGTHILTSSQYRFNSGSLTQGGTFTQEFDRAGRYEYVCALHPQVRGLILVEE